MDRVTEQTFFQRRPTDGQQAHERTIPLINREMQIKTKMTYHLMPIRMTILKKTRDNKCWHGCGGKGTFVYCW